MKQYEINDSYKSSIAALIQSSSRKDMLEAVDKLRSTEAVKTSELKILLDLLTLFAEDIYDDVGTTLSESESCLANNLVKPTLHACVRLLRQKSQNVTYVPGEVELTSMTIQLKNQGIQDDRYHYYADGKIRINSSSQEPLIVEVSNALGQATREKIDLHHTKAMFGSLAILKTIVEQYDHCSFDTFSKLKVHFVHVNGTYIKHWTIMTPEPGVYIMSKEQKCSIPVLLDNMGDELLPFVQFHLNLLTSLLQETLQSIQEVQNEHRSQLQEESMNNVPKPVEFLLSSLVKPIIIRLNESKHSKKLSMSVNKNATFCLFKMVNERSSQCGCTVKLEAITALLSNANVINSGQNK